MNSLRKLIKNIAYSTDEYFIFKFIQEIIHIQQFFESLYIGSLFSHEQRKMGILGLESLMFIHQTMNEWNVLLFHMKCEITIKQHVIYDYLHFFISL